MRCLIVDDEIVPRMVLTDYMHDFGLCVSASNGPEAIAVFEAETNAGRPFDIVYLDIQMPDMDGQDVLLQMRAIEEATLKIDDRRACIIMTTALGDSNNVITAFRHQCDGYLVKPIQKEKLLEKLKELRLLA